MALLKRQKGSYISQYANLPSSVWLARRGCGGKLYWQGLQTGGNPVVDGLIPGRPEAKTPCQSYLQVIVIMGRTPDHF